MKPKSRIHRSEKVTIEAPEQTIHLDNTYGSLKMVATIELCEKSAYYCIVDGKRTKIIK